MAGDIIMDLSLKRIEVCIMNGDTKSGQAFLCDENALQMMKKSGDFEITPCENALDFEDSNRFKKLELGTAQKIHLSAFAQNILPAIATGTVANAYIVKFPEGLPHTLTALNQGGVGSMIRENGKFVGSASFYAMSAQAALMGAFTAMSVASGQYFLSQINNEMRMMNMKLDEILEFLYGEKKAELMAEMSFIRYAYENYVSIISHEQQRIATITSLQEAKKVAMKDIEFYINDLEKTVSYKPKDYSELEARTEKSFLIKESLELSQQLFVMSSMMEVYFAQNQDTEYLKSVEKDMLAYIDKCDKRMLGSFSTLKGMINGYKARPMEKIDKSICEKRVADVVDSLNSGEESDMRKVVRSTLRVSTKSTEYYLNNNGEIFIKYN